MPNITKNLFLSTLTCPTYGYHQHHQPTQQSQSPSDQLRIEEGIEIHQKAQSLYPNGALISGTIKTCISKTKQLLSYPDITTIFEATFHTTPYITKADILTRDHSQWKLIEIKSAVNQDQEHIDDMAYTAFVAQQSGLEISSYCLLLVSKDYRLGMPDKDLFVEIDVSDEVSQRASEFSLLSNDINQVLNSEEQPAPELKWECRNCELFSECCGAGINNHIFELPRISHTKFCQLKDMGVVDIEEIPEDYKLTDNQEIVRQAVLLLVYSNKSTQLPPLQNTLQLYLSSPEPNLIKIPNHITTSTTHPQWQIFNDNICHRF